MKNQFTNLSRHDVVYISESESRQGNLPETSRVEQLIEKIKEVNWIYYENLIFSEDGIECEVLRPNAQGWQKGIVRISVQFMPIREEVIEAVEAETLFENNEQSVAKNPLDVIRQEALQNNL
jgi:KGK domain